jgi:Na+-translocating ferredoxin:NAD+ oxidoreductase subunit G
MDKKLPFKMIVVMMLITAVSGLILSGIWAVSKEKIAKNAKMKIEEALYDLNPSAKSFEIEDMQGNQIYKCLDAQGSLISYFFLASGNGFQAPIKMAITVDPDFKKLVGVRILDQTETPGLGAKITDADFTGKFEALVLKENNPIMCKKDSAEKNNSEIKAITGATISSKACVAIVNDKIAILKYIVGERW